MWEIQRGATPVLTTSTNMENTISKQTLDSIDAEWRLAQGLMAAYDSSLTTQQIAARIKVQFGEYGADNIARALLGDYLQ